MTFASFLAFRDAYRLREVGRGFSLRGEAVARTFLSSFSFAKRFQPSGILSRRSWPVVPCARALTRTALQRFPRHS